MSWDWSEWAVSDSPLVRWDTVGQQVTGTVTAIRTYEFEPGKPVPILDLETDDGDVSVSVDKVDLRRKIVEASPQVGDRVRITFVETVRRERGTLKVFDVQVRRAVPDDVPF